MIKIKKGQGGIETIIKIAILLGIFVFSMLLRLSTLNQIGRTWDEFIYVEQGYKLTELIKKGDLNNSYFYLTYDHPPLVKFLYGIASHFDVQKVINNEPFFNYDYTYSRILSSLMFSLGVVVVLLMGWRLFSPTVGVVAAVTLSMLPFSLGLSQLVTAESLKILVYPMTVYSYIYLIKKFSIKRIVVSGILTGIALQAKQSNALLIFLLISIFFLQYKTLHTYERMDFIKKRIFGVFAVAIIGVLIFILIWPQSIIYFKEIYAINQKLWSAEFSPKPWLITLSPPEIFFGRLMLTPVFYYLVYFLITIPVVVLFLFFVGVRNIIKSKNLYHYTILLWFLIPFIMSVYSWRQHGLRYIIEIYPAIALISGVGFDGISAKFSKKIIHKFLFFTPVVFYLFVSLWQIKPYYLDYFNEVVGGTGTVYKYNLFQTGWWGQGLREAGIYLANNAAKESKIGLAVSPQHSLPKFAKFKYFKWSKESKYDYVIVNHYHIIRDKFDDNLVRQNYNLIYQAKADGATLVYIYKRK